MDLKMLSVIVALEAMNRGAAARQAADVSAAMIERMRFYNNFYENEPDLHRLLLIIDEELNKVGVPRR